MADPMLNSMTPPPPEETDPAGQAVADALRVTFGLLKVIMVLLVVLFALSGWFRVEEGQVAVLLRMGRVVGDPPRVYEPGSYFALPDPVDRVMRLPTSEQTLMLDKSFWFEVKPGEELLPLETRPPQAALVPGRDGSLVTGDRNIVHGRWMVTWSVAKDQAVKFAQNVGEIQRAQDLIRYTAERTLVHHVAGTLADDFVRSGVAPDAIRIAIQKELDDVEAGIEIRKVIMDKHIPPLRLREDFQAVSLAQAERDQAVTKAHTEGETLLTGAAGEKYPEVLAAIEVYESALDTDRAAPALNQLRSLLQGTSVSGTVGERIQQAIGYRDTTEQTIQAEANAFRSLLPRYREAPDVFIERSLQDMLQEVLAGDVETFYLPPDPNKHLYLEINRDPRIRLNKEKKMYQQELENSRQAPAP